MEQESATWEVTGRRLNLNHLDRIIWPYDQLTKADLLTYYQEISPVLLPHFAGRPVTLKLFPEGIDGDAYYQRNLLPQAPVWLDRIPYTSAAGRDIQMPVIENAASLIWLANAGAVEFHLWSSRLPDVSTPDLIIFDLDRGEDVPIDMVFTAALLLRDALQASGLESAPKTSGGRGVHVYVPIVPELPFDTVRDWVMHLAADLTERHPAIFAVAHGSTHQSDRVTIDAAQNSIGRNTAAPYTARGFPGAPVSAPLSWEEVQQAKVEPADFTIKTMVERVQQVGDLFARTLTHDQRLPPQPDL